MRPDLAQRIEAGCAVVTPNRRLAVELTREFARHQIASGRNTWESPDILPLGAFVERCYEEAVYSDQGEGLPVLLAEAQARELWEQAIRVSRWSGALSMRENRSGRTRGAGSLRGQLPVSQMRERSLSPYKKSGGASRERRRREPGRTDSFGG